MEFNEKLQQLRKERGLTQEDLAEALFVSRTAISKWESGRGYPSIDSLKEVSRFFSVSIDELLSGEKLIGLAEKENKANISRICNLLLGMIDVMALALIVFPLYPKPMGDFIASVNLLNYTDVSPVLYGIYWGLYLLMILNGLLKLFMTWKKIEKGQRRLTTASMTFSILAIIFLALRGEPYAGVFAFLLFLAKLLASKGGDSTPL